MTDRATTTQFDRILIVGFGAMTGAMVDGWMRAGYTPERFTIYHPRRDDAPYGIEMVRAWPDGPFDAVLLGVKPDKLADVAGPVARIATPAAVIVSVLAGTTLATLASRFPDAGGVARLMPNLAVALNKSPNALIGHGLTARQRDGLTTLAADLGTAEWLTDESQFDLVTALAGSGPGFVYRFIDALAGSARELGLDRMQAERLAVQMVDGAAALAAASSDTPGDLARKVASPGGMTQAGLDVLDDGDALAVLMQRCLAATRDRGDAMGKAG